MRHFYRKPFSAPSFIVFLALTLAGHGQSSGNSGSINGTVLDPTGAVVPNATVEIHNPVSHFDRSTKTDDAGRFNIPNVPFNPYHMTVSAEGFAKSTQDVDVRSVVAVNTKIDLQVLGSSTSVTVEAGADLVENDPTAHTDVDRALFEKVPLESASSSLSALVTQTTAGVAADSNGLFHGMGDHASNSFSVDGQPITDQQSKVFSNQLPLDSVESLEVIQGAPPAEYGGKTSLVIVATTRSGQGVTTPHGNVTTTYGTFGTSNLGFNLAYGGQRWGNFISANGLDTGRFLDPPEFSVMHDKGNEENLFDRVDFQLSTADSIHVNLGYSRSWFQSPNSYDQEYHFGLANPVTGAPLGATDQRQKIGTFNVAPAWTHIITPSAVFTLRVSLRRDDYNYYPSADPFSDYSPDLQSETVTQDRTLTNAGTRADVTYAKGIHNIKAGVTYQQTYLTENDHIGIVDPTFYPAAAAFYNCLGAAGNPIPTTPCAALKPFDLTQGGSLFFFHGHTDVKEMALYIQDSITKGSWSFNLGIRGDLYNGLAIARQAEPRVGMSYNIKPSNTVLRISYARTLESPFNENLVIASTGCSIPFLAALVPPFGVPCNSGPILPAIEMSSTPAYSRRLGATWLWMASMSGNTPTTATISASWAALRSHSRSNGTIPKYRDTRSA